MISCIECNEKLPLRVCRSAAGYYVGHWCNNCGPHDRQSSYYASMEEATEALAAYEDVTGRFAEEEPVFSDQFINDIMAWLEG